MTQQIGRDVDRVIIVSRYTIFPGPDDLDAIPAPQAAHAPLFTDMSRHRHIIVLTLAHRLNPPRAENTRCDLHNFAKKRDWSFLLLGVDKGEPHRL